MVVLLRIARPVGRAIQPAPAWRGTFLGLPQVQAVAVGAPGVDRGPAPRTTSSVAVRDRAVIYPGLAARRRDGSGSRTRRLAGVETGRLSGT